MRLLQSTASIVAAALAVLPSNSGLASPLKPTTPWRVDYDSAQCVAARNYGTADNPLMLVLKPSPEGSVMRVLVYRKGVTDVSAVQATLKFGKATRVVDLLSYPDDSGHFRIAAVNLPMGAFKANAATTSIGIASLPLSETFAISNLTGVLAELDKCVVDLQDYWNIGPRYSARIAKPDQPKKPLQSLFSSDDYPGMSLNQRQQGSVALTFLVDEKGEVSDCSIEETSGIAALDTMSCYVIRKRAHFDPAKGPGGKPIRSAHESRIIWRIAG